MLSNRFFISFLVGWPMLVFITLTSRIAWLSAGLSLSDYATWLFLASAPVALGLILMRGRSTRSIAHVLYETERAGDAGRQRRVGDRPSAGGHVPAAQENRGAKAQETLADLYQLVDALSRRVPRVERLGEAQIARDAAALRARAVGQIRYIEDNSPKE